MNKLGISAELKVLNEIREFLETFHCHELLAVAIIVFDTPAPISVCGKYTPKFRAGFGTNREVGLDDRTSPARFRKVLIV